MEWYNVLMLIGIPSIICVIFSSFWTKIMSRAEKRQKEEQEKEAKLENDIILLKEANQAQLQAQLYEMGDRLKKQKYASMLEKTCYEKLYNSYHKLGQNGVMTDLYCDVMDLPTEKPQSPRQRKTK